MRLVYRGLFAFIGSIVLGLLFLLSHQHRHERRALSANLQPGTTIESALSAAVDFLHDHQIQKDRTIWFDGPVIRQQDWQGNWPQYFRVRNSFFSFIAVRDISPFIPEFVHHSLTLCTVITQDALSLSDTQINKCQKMRKNAVAFVRRFVDPVYQTIGFWPVDRYPHLPGPLLTQFAYILFGRGPVLGGDLTPYNAPPILPQELNLPEDSDCYSNGYWMLRYDEMNDGGPVMDLTAIEIAERLEDWRDVGTTPLRLVYDWMDPRPTGTFLTWMPYNDDGKVYGNDIDIGVVANCLFLLGQLNVLESTDGVLESIDIINRLVVDLGIHNDKTRFNEIAPYYTDTYILQYFITRAFHESGVSGLSPSVERFVLDLSADVVDNGNIAYWNRGEPVLTTANAVLTLLNAAQGDLVFVPKAIQFLIESQERNGGWNGNGVFFIAPTEKFTADFTSASFTTSRVFEALARWQMLQKAKG